MSEIKPLRLGFQHAGDLAKESTMGKTQYELLVDLVNYINERIPITEFTYKGGMFLGQHTGRPRHTQDINLTITDETLYLDFRKVLSDFGEMLISRGDVVTYEVKDTVEPNMSGGAKYRDGNGKVLLSIDISWHATELDNVLIDTKEFGAIRISSVEQILCDKLTVLFSRKRFRRSKDLYDTWLILKTCKVNEDRLVLCLQERGIFPLPVDKAPFREDCYLQMEHAYDTLRIADATSELPLEKPSYEEVVKIVGDFIFKYMGM